MTNKEIFEMCERPFTPQVTMEQIMSGDCDIKKFISWNIDHRISVLKNEHDECVGMIMKMDNSRYDDMVFITLSWDDTYRIRFVNKNFEILKDIEGIYCDFQEDQESGSGADLVWQSSYDTSEELDSSGCCQTSLSAGIDPELFPVLHFVRFLFYILLTK